MRVIHALFCIAFLATCVVAQTVAVPYTVTLQREHLTSTEAIRADGARAISIVESRKNGIQERIVDFLDGREVYINDRLRRKVTNSSPLIKPQNYVRSAEANCILSERETFKGAETVSGYRAARITRNSRVEFYALDYGCARLDGTVLSLKKGEPPAELFADPVNYEEVPRSQLFAQSKVVKEMLAAASPAKVKRQSSKKP